MFNYRKITLLLASLLLPLTCFAKQNTDYNPLANERSALTDQAQLAGIVSCYSPCKRNEKKCDRDMQGGDEVKYPKFCPGMRPIENSYQTGDQYVVAASGTLKSLVGLGAKVKIEGIPGVGIVCDSCPGCDRYGKILDIASSNKKHRIDCPLQAERRITVLETNSVAGTRPPRISGIYDRK